MKFQRVAIVFSIFNLLLLLFQLAHIRSFSQHSVMPIVRTQAFELMDKSGKKRAQINVDEETGEVVFRLRDSKGDIRAKFGADERGSGLILMNDRTDATVRIRAAQAGASITLFDREGHERVVK
ncbi:MAG TPA: hypothetical protein PKD26_13705 [Pyrinomonadaceae bacterium]|nr:hypothetical protein [Pyrinomonadaceae bacterium]